MKQKLLLEKTKKEKRIKDKGAKSIP